MDNLNTDDAPCIMLAGKAWPVPLLAARQNRIIDPLILSLLPIFAKCETDKAYVLSQLRETQYEALLEIAFQAIRRAHPEINREAFLDMPVTLPELIGAFPVIAQQTGVFERASPGEAGAGNARFPNGTASSPMSAT